MCRPGATRSGFASPSYVVGPHDDHDGVESSAIVLVPLSSTAPTVITNGSSPGTAIEPAPGPELPADTTTATPANESTSTAVDITLTV